MKLDSSKKSRRDRMIHSKSFETQKIGEIGRKEARELKDFPMLWIRMIEDVFQMEGMQRPGKIENILEKIHARARKVL